MQPKDIPALLGTTSGTEQQAPMQVVGVDELKGALKSVFDKALAQFKAVQPARATEGKHTWPSLTYSGDWWSSPPLLTSVVHSSTRDCE